MSKSFHFVCHVLFAGIDVWTCMILGKILTTREETKWLLWSLGGALKIPFTGHPIPQAFRLMQISWWDNMARASSRVISQKKFSTELRRSKKEIRDKGSEPDRVDQKVLPLQRRMEGHSGCCWGPPPVHGPSHAPHIPEYHFQISKQLLRHGMSVFPKDMALPLTAVESRRQPSNKWISFIISVCSPSVDHPGLEGNNLMWKKSYIKMEKGEVTIETQPQLGKLAELNRFLLTASRQP